MAQGKLISKLQVSLTLSNSQVQYSLSGDGGVGVSGASVGAVGGKTPFSGGSGISETSQVLIYCHSGVLHFTW